MRSIRLDMLELMGSGYVIEHCVSAFRKEQAEMQYRSYIADALKALADNTARHGGVIMRERYADMIGSGKKKDTRTGDEIAQDVIKRAGLRIAE